MRKSRATAATEWIADDARRDIRGRDAADWQLAADVDFIVTTLHRTGLGGPAGDGINGVGLPNNGNRAQLQRLATN
jgi:hypothetical protein